MTDANLFEAQALDGWLVDAYWQVKQQIADASLSTRLRVHLNTPISLFVTEPPTQLEHYWYNLKVPLLVTFQTRMVSKHDWPYDVYLRPAHAVLFRQTNDYSKLKSLLNMSGLALSVRDRQFPKQETEGNFDPRRVAADAERLNPTSTQLKDFATKHQLEAAKSFETARRLQWQPGRSIDTADLIVLHEVSLGAVVGVNIDVERKLGQSFQTRRLLTTPLRLIRTSSFDLVFLRREEHFEPQTHQRFGTVVDLVGHRWLPYLAVQYDGAKDHPVSPLGTPLVSMSEAEEKAYWQERMCRAAGIDVLRLRKNAIGDDGWFVREFADFVHLSLYVKKFAGELQRRDHALLPERVGEYVRRRENGDISEEPRDHCWSSYLESNLDEQQLAEEVRQEDLVLADYFGGAVKARVANDDRSQWGEMVVADGERGGRVVWRTEPIANVTLMYSTPVVQGLLSEFLSLAVRRLALEEVRRGAVQK